MKSKVMDESVVGTHVASRQQGLAQCTGGAGGGAGGGDRSASHARLGTAGAPQQAGPAPDQHLLCEQQSYTLKYNISKIS